MRVNVKKIGIMIQQNFRSMIVCNFILTNSMGKLVYSDYSFSVLIMFWFLMAEKKIYPEPKKPL